MLLDASFKGSYLAKAPRLKRCHLSELLTFFILRTAGGAPKVGTSSAVSKNSWQQYWRQLVLLSLLLMLLLYSSSSTFRNRWAADTAFELCHIQVTRGSFNPLRFLPSHVCLLSVPVPAGSSLSPSRRPCSGFVAIVVRDDFNADGVIRAQTENPGRVPARCRCGGSIFSSVSLPASHYLSHVRLLLLRLLLTERVMRHIIWLSGVFSSRSPR